MEDKKAKKILFDKFWHSYRGWQNNDISNSDFEYAKKAGVMFDPIINNHDLIIKKCVEICKETNKRTVVNAFISSLSSRDLGQRSSLSSFACGQNLPLHQKREQDKFSCSICSEFVKNNTVDLNILNFERLKFGGVRHLNPTYIWLDLSILSKYKISKPNENDIIILKNIIDTLKTASIRRLSETEKILKSIVESNKNEREGLISTFGFCGILNVPKYHPFHLKYTPACERDHSDYSKSDWPFPADLWLPKYGFNEESIDYWFGEYIK